MDSALSSEDLENMLFCLYMNIIIDDTELSENIRNILSEDILDNNRNFDELDIGAYEIPKRGINIEDIIISFGSVIPSRARKEIVTLQNNHPTCTVSDITIEFNISDTSFEILNYPESLQPGEIGQLEISFTPDQMFKNYSNIVILTCDDTYFPEIQFEVKGSSFLHNGWNWVSFPIENPQTVEILEELNPFGLSITSGNGGYMIYDIDNNSWEYYGLDHFDNNKCYKVNMSNSSDSYDVTLNGAPPCTFTTLFADQDNWVGYWLTNSQNLDDAFGDDFEKVISIKSETWYYGSQPTYPDRDGSQVSPSKKIRPLHFGRGYVVRVSETIENFDWNYNGGIFDGDPIMKSQFFTYEEKPDYEVIDVIDIPENIVEIGVFENETCVGAVVVDEPGMQILVYSDNSNRDPVPFTFEIVNNRSLSSRINNYSVFNWKTWLFEPGSILSGMQEYSIVTFGDGDHNVTLNNIILHKNYPNPFNPETTISFTIPNESKVDLSIYNIKGQKVRTLAHGKFEKGYHHIIWNSKDDKEKSTASGIYFYKLKVNGKDKSVRKCLLLK